MTGNAKSKGRVERKFVVTPDKLISRADLGPNFAAKTDILRVNFSRLINLGKIQLVANCKEDLFGGTKGKCCGEFDVEKETHERVWHILIKRNHVGR